MGETSPHTRGKRLFAWLVRDGLRNIPAYAGKTAIRLTAEQVSEKHPRIRGENYKLPKNHSWKSETSPHTRGKPQRIRRTRHRHRNIPAYAGKTL